MIKLKVILFLIGVFLVSSFSGFFFEDYYRILIRYLFRLFSGNNISFYGKGFQFPGYFFIIGFGFLCTLISLFALRKKFLKIVLIILVFSLTTMATSYLDSKSKIVMCDVCKDNKRILNYNDIDYNFHFFVGLALSLLSLRINRLKRIKKKTTTWDFSSAFAEEK